MRAHFVELLTAVANPTEQDHLAEEFSSRPATMIAVLDRLEAKYGGAEEYYVAAGSAATPSLA